MRLPISSLSNRNSFFRSSSNTYSIKLPYLGEISLGKSPLNLKSFQKPLRELYISYYQTNSHQQRRIIISDHDILIFEPDAVGRNKRSFICSNFESIIDIQILKISFHINQQHIQTAFLPIGCEHEERFQSLYSSINQSQYKHLSKSTLIHPSLFLFLIQKPGIGKKCSLLDCHVFIIHREITAFELSDMIKKLIIKQTMSPLLTKKLNNHLLLNVNFNDVGQASRNPSLSVINNVQHSYNTSKVLTMNSDIHSMSLKQRHFIKASKIIQDESDEIVNDLMNIVANEKLKSQNSIKHHELFEHMEYSDDYTMNKKRYFHNKKRLINPNSRIDGQLLRPHIVLNRYGDIGNYVPKFLRENITIRSSDSNENIFFRSTSGHLLNDFLKLDVLSTSSLNQTNMEINSNENNHRIPSFGDILNDIKIHSFLPTNISSSKLPINYRQNLHHKDQGIYVHDDDKRQQTTLEHSLGYFP